MEQRGLIRHAAPHRPSLAGGSGPVVGGDFNYDGTTNIDDFAVLAPKFNGTVPALSAPDS